MLSENLPRNLVVVSRQPSVLRAFGTEHFLLSKSILDTLFARYHVAAGIFLPIGRGILVHFPGKISKVVDKVEPIVRRTREQDAILGVNPEAIFSGNGVKLKKSWMKNNARVLRMPALQHVGINKRRAKDPISFGVAEDEARSNATTQQDALGRKFALYVREFLEFVEERFSIATPACSTYQWGASRYRVREVNCSSPACFALAGEIFCAEPTELRNDFKNCVARRVILDQLTKAEDIYERHECRCVGHGDVAFW